MNRGGQFASRRSHRTTEPAGNALFGMMGVLFELAMIRERVPAGLEQARREGKRLWRPRLALRERIQEALKAGGSVRKTAAQFRVNASTVQAISSDL